MHPIQPVYRLLENNSATVHREGSLFLEFAPAMALREYDWSRKQTFALSITEIGHLLCLTPDGSCEFYHDPNKGKRCCIFLLSGIDERIGLPILHAEFAVMRTAMNFVLPYLMGWHALVDPTALNLLAFHHNSPDGLRDDEFDF
eukprot:SM000032S12062  [mRNA]  locus=s32:349130:350489:+ [translate_table: standard]